MSNSLENLEQYPDRLADTFRDKTIFITGGTGFLGKVLVEKILRCLEVKKIYMLVRPKKGKQCKERKKDVFSNPLFDQLKEMKGEQILDLVEFINGDMLEIDLGISSDDRKKLTEEVEFIFNTAATVRFDEELKKAVLLNVRGVRFVLNLTRQCKKLMNFCHVSTAYCHLNERILYEKAYPPPADPEAIIRICEMLSNDVINNIQDKILGDFPNTYAFTKSLGEALVVDELDKLPVIVLRPSVVVPIWKEPIPGWTDNINGPTGLLIGAGKGVIRTMYGKEDTYSDYVPVDIVVNTLLCSATDYIVYKGVRRIYNVTSSAEYKVTFKEILDIGRVVIEKKIPLNGVFWYPGGNLNSSRLVHNFNFFFFQWVPAVIVDILLVILGYEPVLKRVQRRILKGYDVFEYYANRQWDFDNEGSMRARKLMNPREKLLYTLDGAGINYEEYFTSCTYAARRYILKETDDMIPAAKRHMRVMWWADTLCKMAIVFAFFYFVVWKLILAPLFGIS